MTQSTTDDYVRLKDVPTLMGVHPRLLTRRIRAGELDGVRDPRDRRNVLVLRADLERLMTPDGGTPTPARADRAAELATAS